MEPMDVIITRRSIRKFKNKPVSQDELNSILKAGMYAPSARNQQPWHFIVINNAHLKEAIMNAHPYASMLKEAPVAILVCADPSLEKTPGYWAIDCSAATQNILLAAHSLGFGSVWLGVHPRKERKEAIGKILGLPGHIEPFALVALGYPGEEKDTPERWRPERVHINGWREQT
jgi:nitroreductase